MGRISVYPAPVPAATVSVTGSSAKALRNLMLAVCLLLWLLLFTGCSQTKTGKPSASDPMSLQSEPNQNESAPLLLLDEEPLLLLDEVPEAVNNDPDAADNTRCGVCHLNLIEEELAFTHARAGIGCAECHGPSDAHIADESWASGGNGTAPDIMFTKSEINSGCLDCHEDLAEGTEHGLVLLAAPNSEEHCTDCHGEHRIVNRKCSWK
jgi:hypothetical protein